MVDKLKEYTGEVIPSESSNTPEGLTEYTGEVLDPLTPDYSFGQLASKSFDRGLERFKSTYGDVLPAMALSALGFDEAAKRQMEEARQSEEYIQRIMRPQFASFRDVNWANPIDISKFIVETVGEQGVNLAGVLVPGGAGAKIGEKLATREALKRISPKITDKANKKIFSNFAKLTDPAVARGRNIGQTSGIFLGSYGLNAPEVFRNIYEQTGSFEPGAAALAGVINASLDSILPATILNQFGRSGRATIVSEILERSGMSPNLARKAVVQIAGSGVLEGLTEATQEAVSITAENFVQDHSYLFDSEDFERLLEGGVRGTVAGGAFRGVGVAASNLRDKFAKTEADKKDGKEGTATDTGTETPPTTLEEQQLLLEQQKRLTDQTIYGQDLTGPRQLELDLEGGPVQGELFLPPVDTSRGQLELEGLGPKPVGPLVPPVDPRQTELDFDDQTQLPERPYFSNQVPLGPQSELDFEGQPEGQFAPVQGDLFFPSRPESPLTDTPTTPTEGEFKSVTQMSDKSKQAIAITPEQLKEKGTSNQVPIGIERLLSKEGKNVNSGASFAMSSTVGNAYKKDGKVSPSDIIIEDNSGTPIAAAKTELYRKGKTVNFPRRKQPNVSYLPALHIPIVGSNNSKAMDVLIEEAKARAKKAGVRYIVLDDVTSEGAIKAFKKRGFKDGKKGLFEGAPIYNPLQGMRDRNLRSGQNVKNLYLDLEATPESPLTDTPTTPKPAAPTADKGINYYQYGEAANMESNVPFEKKFSIDEIRNKRSDLHPTKEEIAKGDFDSRNIFNQLRAALPSFIQGVDKNGIELTPYSFSNDLQQRILDEHKVFQDKFFSAMNGNSKENLKLQDDYFDAFLMQENITGKEFVKNNIYSPETLKMAEQEIIALNKEAEIKRAKLLPSDGKVTLPIIRKTARSRQLKKPRGVSSDSIKQRLIGLMFSKYGIVSTYNRYVGFNPDGRGTTVGGTEAFGLQTLIEKMSSDLREFEIAITPKNARKALNMDAGVKKYMEESRKIEIKLINAVKNAETRADLEVVFSPEVLNTLEKMAPPIDKKLTAKPKATTKKTVTKKATPKTTTVDPKLIGKEVEVTVGKVKQKGTYVDMQGTPFISSPIPQERGGGTQSQAIPANAKVKEVKEKPLKSIRQGNPTDQKIINRLKPKKTLGQVLNIIKSSNVTAAQKELATLLLTIPNISKTDFKVVENLEFLNDAYGEYNRQQDSIQISNNADVETVLHEAVHAATANLLNKHIRDGVGITNLGRRIVRLYEEAIAADVNGRFPTELSKIDEFIAESFTNPEFQKFLANSESSTSSRAEDAAYEQDLKSQGVRPNVIRNIMNERRGTNSLLSSLWSKFVNAIKDLLGIENAIFSYSILNDVIALAPELFVGPNKREQAGATQELLFKKSVIQMLQDSGAMVGKYTKEAITPRIAENIAEVIGRQPIADNRAGRSLVRNISNAPQALLDVYAKILSLPQQIEMFGEYLPSLSDVRRFLEIKAFDIKKGREEIERLVAFGESLKEKYTSTTAGKKVFKEWNQVLLGLSGLDTNPDTILADPNGLANLSKENPKAAALVRRYEKLPQDLKNLSRQIVTDLEVRYKKLLDTVLADIERGKDGKMSDFEKAIREQYKARPFYLPFVRKGDYWFEYQTRDGEYGQASADSAANRSIKIKRMKKEDGITDVKLITRDSAMASTGMVPNDYVEALREGLKGIDLTPEQQVTIDSLIKETQIALFPNESLSNNRKTRKAVPGYIEDIVFAYADVAPKIVSSTANQQYNKQLVVAINKVGKEANEPAAVNSNLVRAVANNVIGRSGFMLNPIAGDISRLAAYGSYFWFLGFNVSSAIVNITQIPLVVVPYLAGEYTGLGVKGQGKAWSEIQKAMKLYFSGPGKKGFFQTENTGRFAPDATMAPVKIDLETGEKTYLGPNAKLFKPGGKYHDLFNKAEEAAALRRGVGYEIVELNRDLGAEVESGNRIKAKAEKLVGYMFQNSERFNREVTLVSAFEMEMKYGSGNKDVAIQKAIEFTSKVHSHALPEVGPSLFQDGLGKIAFVFKRFAQAQAYLIMKLFYDGPFKFSRNIKNNPNLTEEEKTQLLAEKLAAKKQLAGIYGYSFLMAGAAGVPLYGLMKMIMEGLFDDDDEPFDFDVFVNQAIGDMGYRGPLSYAIGADVSRRTGYNNLFFQEDPQRLAEIGLPTYALETMFGPAFSGVRRFASGFEYLQRGQEMRALERFTPTAISNTVKALRQSMEGVRNKNGVKIIEDDPSLYETFMQIVGFTNPEVSEAYARAEALKGPERKLNLRRQNLLLRYWLASQEGDTDAVKDIIEEMKGFNKKVPPAMRITPAVRNRSKKARQKSTNDSVFGINLPKTYKDDMEDIYDIDTGNILDLDIFD